MALSDIYQKAKLVLIPRGYKAGVAKLYKDLDESPHGWKSYDINVEGNVVHTFLGINFNRWI